MLSKFLGKEVFSTSKLSYIYTKKQNLWAAPQWLLGFPNLSIPKFCLVVSAHNLYNILHFKSKCYRTLYEEGTTWSFMNFFHAWASVAMPSKSEGSRKRIFISYLAAWYLITSILSRLRCNCSSSHWILTTAWAIAFFKICSSRSLNCWISCSSF